MSRIISAAVKSNKPPIFPLIFDCYIDTIIVFFPTSTLPRQDWNLLRTLYGATPHHHRNRKMGYMLVGFQCPQPDMLRALTRLNSGKLYRLDIGCDARHAEDYTVEEQHRFLKEHMLLMHRTAKRILEIENEDTTIGCYYCPHAHIQGALRDICLYWGLNSKLDPLNICAHFDLRLRGEPIRHLGLDRLEHLDPSGLVLRHIRFVEFERRQWERKLFRKVMKEARSLPEATALIAYMKRHDQLDYVQRVHDQHQRVTLHTSNDLVMLPDTLTWGATRRKSKEKAIYNEINALGMDDCILRGQEYAS
ncbi:hypothetical protein [Bradyrhizobium cenepequi]|uniref:hypothetical protein n=1 Tax=Bradyrhizobium cenepequi TaxID=2821403 RepID=UPI001CE2777B|nr:hypothetical protein [Bradyrhizobium cenepequi]MCA6106114.1 hypothetical protein [Bradyrhizobium cenepequi]